MLGRPYKRVRLLPRGGQADEVHLGVDLRLDRPVVIKRCRADRAQVLVNEYRGLLGIDHPNAIRALDLFAEEPRTGAVGGPWWCLVLSHAPGPDFVTWARADPAPARVARGAAAVVRALAYLHERGLVHRDVKPDNVRVGDGSIGRLPAARLIDFGLATGSPPAGITGTRGYIAPEVLDGQPAGPAADLYGVGALMLEALTAAPPETIPHDRAVVWSKVASLSSRSLAELILDLLQHDPGSRPGWRSLIDTLGAVAGDSLRLTADELATDYAPCPPLIGRDHQLQRVGEMLEAAARGEPQLLQARGAGKTAMTTRACQQARLLGFTVVELDSDEALLQATGQSLRPNEARQQVATRVVDHLIGDGDGAAPPMLVAASNVAGPDGDKLATMVLDQLALVATDERRPRPWMLLCDGPAPVSAAVVWRRLDLPDLEPDDVRELVQGMLHHLREDEIDWLDEVYPLAGGNPRRVVDLVHRQIERGLPRRISKVETHDDPDTARQLLATLAPAQRALLAAVAHNPGTVPPAILGAVVSPEALASLGTLLARGLVLVTGRGVHPASPMIRRAAGPRDDRSANVTGQAAVLHRRYAEAWAALPDSPPEVVGYHLLRAGAVEQAAPLLAEAPAASEQLLAELADRLPRAHPSRAAVLARLARAARASAGTDDLERALALADQLADQAPGPAELLRAEILIDAGRGDDALAVLDRTTDAGEPPTHDASHAALRQLLRARARALLGDFTGAIDEARRGRDQPVTVAERAQLDNVIGLAATYLGRPAEGLELLRTAESAARQGAETEILARVLNSIGIALQRLGRLDEAITAHQECAGIYRHLGDLRLAAACALNLGGLAFRRMDLTGALAQYRKAAALGHRGALETTSAWAAASEANLLLLFGDLAAAEACLQRADTLAGDAGRSLKGHILLYRAESLRLAGRIEAALQLVERARAMFLPSDQPGQVATLLQAGDLQLLTGDVAAANATAQRLLEQLPNGDPERWRGQLLAGRVAAVDPAADPRAGIEALQSALAAESPQGGSEHHFEILAALADCHQRLGQSDEAVRSSERCGAALATLRGRVPPPYRRAFDARPDVAGIRRRVTPAGEDPSRPSVQGMQRLLEINRDLGLALNRGTAPNELLGRILDGAIELAGAERGFILMRRGERLKVVASRNLDHEPVRRGVEKFSQSIAEQALEQDAPVVVADAINDDRFRAGLSVSSLRLRAVLCVPLRVQDQAGALYVDNRFGTGVFGGGAVALARAFADQVGIVMQSARLLAETAKQRQQLARAKVDLEAANLRLSDQVQRQSTQLGKISVRLQHHEEELIRRFNAGNLIGRSKPMRALFTQIDRVGTSDVPVLIHGESGTGKELVARAIHQASPERRHQPFLAINCGAIPASLLESELFGTVRGAFTGAQRDRPGVFEAAGAGTLLLDEVADMNPEMQVKLLRVLQEGTFRRLGDDRERRSACRVLSASHRRLAQLVAEGGFREDLYYRINVLEIHVAPLRQRREDIPLLVQFFLQRERAEPPVKISSAAMRALIDFGWPGNVRQLENELKRAALLSDDTIELAHLSLPVVGGADAPTHADPVGLRDAVQGYERRLIEETLRETGFNVSEAARRLQIHRVLLHRKMRLLGVSREVQQ